MSENAPLQNRFRERVDSRWTSVPFKNSALLTRLGQDEHSNEKLSRGQEKLIWRCDTFSGSEQRCTHNLAAHYVAAFVLRGRAICTSRTVAAHRRLRRALNGDKGAVIRELEPAGGRDHHDRQTRSWMAKKGLHTG